MIKNKDIIVMGLQSWDSDIGSNCINIAKEFSKNNRVLYVNRAVDRISLVKSALKGDFSKFGLNRTPLNKLMFSPIYNMWVFDPGVVLESINFFPEKIYDALNKLNCKKLAAEIQKAANKIGFKDPILFVDNDFFRVQHLTDYLKVSCFIYYIRDFLINQAYFKRHGARVEKSVIEKADVVVANSSYLSNYAHKFNVNSIDVGQGCDFTYFDSSLVYDKPSDLQHLNGPIIGYVGALVNIRLDIFLLEKLAMRKPDWNLVLVGPEDESFKRSKLHDLPNVHFLGRKDQSELARYVSNFDVCINPQLVNDLTIGNYPRKVDEYLAMGKPVVATYTEFMQIFLPWVYLCKDLDEYEAAIEASLLETDVLEKTASRQQFAKAHTWENSVAKIYELYNTVNQSNE
jgi:glycosyltransferase involved in cell wall biosynthesis